MIKKWIEFNEVSGTELIGPFGMGSEREKAPITLNTSDTDVIYSDITGIIYTQDDYDLLYGEYLKNGGTPLFGFNKENLEKLIAE